MNPGIRNHKNNRLATITRLRSIAKAQKRTAAANMKQQQTLNITDTTKPTATSFPLFELPAELRNLVYEHIASDDVLYIMSNGILKSSGLLKANRTLRNEYFPVLLANVPTVQADICNFDFTELIAFIDDLRTPEVRVLLPALKAGTCKMRIMLYITDYPSSRSWLLKEWLVRKRWIFQDGTRICTSYQLTGFEHRPCPMYACGRPGCAPSKLWEWMDEVDSYEEDADDALVKAEAEKIQAALNERTSWI